jgi:hypothetical protein
MKKKYKIGPVEQEFVYKQGMNERLIDAYQITVKDILASKKKENNEYKNQSNVREKKNSHLCQSILSKTK